LASEPSKSGLLGANGFGIETTCRDRLWPAIEIAELMATMKSRRSGVRACRQTFDLKSISD
jgi:hypothetical protein